jgi:hypothetical protein
MHEPNAVQNMEPNDPSPDRQLLPKDHLPKEERNNHRRRKTIEIKVE